MYSIYFEYYGNIKQAGDEIDDIMKILLNNNNLDYAHRGFCIADKLYDVRYDCDDIETINLIMSMLMKTINNIHKLEFTNNK